MMFNKTVIAYHRQDDMCSLSRLYLSKYILMLPKKDSQILTTAGKFSTLDHCPTEENIYTFLSGQPIAPDTLEQPYKAYAKFENTHNVSVLIDTARNDTIADYSKTRLMRYAAKQLMKTDLDKAKNILLEAKKIDRYNGWSIAIHQDLILLKEVCLKKNEDCTSLEKRITLLGSILHKN